MSLLSSLSSTHTYTDPPLLAPPQLQIARLPFRHTFRAILRVAFGIVPQDNLEIMNLLLVYRGSRLSRVHIRNHDIYEPISNCIPLDATGFLLRFFILNLATSYFIVAPASAFAILPTQSYRRPF